MQRPRADAGDRAGEPGLPGQAGRAGRRLPRARRPAAAGARDLHRERRDGRDGDRPGRGRRGDAGEARGLLRPVPRLRLVGVDDRHARRSAGALASGAGAHPRAGGRQEALLQAVADLSKAFALAVPHDEALAIADDVALLPGRAGRARQVGRHQGGIAARTSTTPSGRSSRGRSRPTRWSTSSPRRG